MATNLKTPGVYVQEIKTLPSSVAGVETAIPAFVGYVEKAQINGVGIPMLTPTRVSSFLDFVDIFGGPDPQSFVISVADVVVGSNKTRTTTVVKGGTESTFRMYYNVRMFFANGGGPCYIVPVDFYSTAVANAVSKDQLISGINALERESEPTLIVFPDVLSLTSNSDINEVNTTAITQCANLKNRFTVLDVKQTTLNPETDGNAFKTDCVGANDLKYAAAYYPYLNTSMNFGVSGLLTQINSFSLTIDGIATATPQFLLSRDFNARISEAVQGTINAINYLNVAKVTLLATDSAKVKLLIGTSPTTGLRGKVTAALAISGLTAPFVVPFNFLNTPPIQVNLMTPIADASDLFDTAATRTLTNANVLKALLENLLIKLNEVLTKMTTAYNTATLNFVGGNLNYLNNNRPSLSAEINAAMNGYRVTLNPSGAMVGIYSRVDSTRGVWQAPANVGVQNVIGPAVLVTNSQQASLNVDSVSGKSINVIRNFTGRGTLPWGARTLDGNSNEWRYINVRRLFIYIEESIKRSTQFVVFEPNDANTWVLVKGMISNFLTNVWRDGGLVGSKTDEAFFVKVGVGETMTTQDVLEGRMNIELGLAASRPAEFIVLKFSHQVNQE